MVISIGVKTVAFLPLLLLCCLASSCKRGNQTGREVRNPEDDYFTTKPTLSPELLKNNLAEEPTEFLKSQAQSPIHWQPYTPKVLIDAENAQRLIFVLVGATAFPESRLVAEAIAESEAEAINTNYIPVLADAELDPSLMETCDIFASERRVPTAFPVAFILTHEGNLVHNLSINFSEPETIAAQFRRSHEIITLIQKDFRYIIEDSRHNNETRLKNLLSFRDAGAKDGPESETDRESEPQATTNLTRKDYYRATQRLLDLYDALNRDFDNAGGIPPGDLVSLLAQVAAHPGAPSRLQAAAPMATRDVLDKIVRSALCDPLDSFFFARRASPNYSIPVFAKNLSIQSELLAALALSPTTAPTLRAERELVAALMKERVTSRSVWSLQEALPNYTWSEEELQEILTEEEYKHAEQAFELLALGNIPKGEDPLGVYFRRNTLGLAKSQEELAEATGLTSAESNRLLQTLISKIAAKRSERLQTNARLLTETREVIGSQAQLLGALSKSATVRPTDPKREAVEALATSLMSSFRSPEGKLLRTLPESGERQIPALAIDYIRVADALLDYYQFSGNTDALVSTKELVGEVLDGFLDEDGYLFERPAQDRIVSIPNYNHTMVFGASTWGLGLSVLNRTASLGFSHPRLEAAIVAMTEHLDKVTMDFAFLHTDYLLNAILHQPRLVLLVSQEERATFREKLSSLKFASILVVAEGAATSELPKLGDQSAILLQNGAIIQSWNRSAKVPRDLADYLSKN